MSKLIRILFITISGLMPLTAGAQTAPSSANNGSKQGDVSAKPANALPVPKPNGVKEEDCGCESPVPDVLAVVNGIKITNKDVNSQVETRVRNLQRQVIEARKRELDLQINSKLLEAEAKKRNVSATKLIEDEIVAKVKEPTEAEAQTFYDQNKTRIQGEFKDVKANIIAYLRDQQEREEAKKFAQRLRSAAQVNVLVKEVTPARTTAERARVLATINGEPITAGDIENSLRPLIDQVQEQVYLARKAALDRQVNILLLEQEAQKRKVTSRALLESEVIGKTPRVTEADAQAFYNGNKDQMKGEFPQLKDQIIQYLQEREANKQASAFAEQLRRGASVQAFLAAPESPVLQISTDDQPTKGSPTARVTIVEFTDYECPSCAEMHPVLDRISAEYGERVHLVVRDFPLSQHKHALKAAEAAEAAREQGKYWEYVALLYANQKALDVPHLKEYASQVGLNRKQFDAALDSGKFAAKVQRDLEDGEQLGVSGTPTIFINGRRLTDRSYEAMRHLINKELQQVSSSNQNGSSGQ